MTKERIRVTHRGRVLFAGSEQAYALWRKRHVQFPDAQVERAVRPMVFGQPGQPQERLEATWDRRVERVADASLTMAGQPHSYAGRMPGSGGGKS